MASQGTGSRGARQPVSGPAAGQRIEVAIRQAILDHRLAPGAKLGELALAGLFAVSRGSVRAALARLGHARLVELRPSRGAVVASPSVDESRQIFEARRALECAIVAKVAAAPARTALRELRAIVAGEKASYAGGDENAGLRWSIGFHRKLAELADNAVLMRFMEELVSRTPLIALSHGGRAPSTCGVDDHAAIVQAIAAGDSRRAVDLMRGHIARLEQQLDLRRPAPPRTLADALGRRTAR